jgi:hypothetical protein
VGFRRLGVLGGRQWLMLSQLVLLAGGISVGLRITSFAKVVEAVANIAKNSYFGWFPMARGKCAFDEQILLVGIASRISPRNQCLVRSLMIFWLMCARHEAAEIVLGVNKRGEEFRAHAWALNRSGVIGDDPTVLEEFSVLARYGNGLTV